MYRQKDETEANGLSSVAPPHDEEAEASVLGAIMLADRWLVVAADVVGLVPGDFYRPRNRAIFTAMLELRSERERVDTLTVAGRLTETAQLEEAGGKDYIETLVTRIPAIGNTKQYAKIVLENSWLRQLVRISQEIQESVASREGDPGELLRRARDRAADLAAAAQVDQAAKVSMTPATSAWSVPGSSTLQPRVTDEPAGDWQSIESVPRGPYVLIFCESWAEEFGQYALPMIAYYDADAGWCSDDGNAVMGEPTCWAPLLRPPAEGEVTR